MRAMLDWMMAARWRAALAVLAAASLPLLDLLSAAVLALVVLRHGLREGLLVAAVAAMAVFAIDALLGMPPTRVVVLVAMSWTPAVLMATVLRVSASQPRVLQAAAMLGCGVVVGVFAALGDPAASWQALADERLLPWLDEAGVRYDRAALESGLPAISGLMTGLAAGSWIVGQWLAVMLGRWWQAVLYNPGGFRREFHTLRLGAGLTVAAGALFVASPLTGHPLATNLALVMVMVFAIQGMSVVHGVVGLARMHWAWLAGLYTLFILLPPHLMGLLAVLGFVDQWLDIRGRLGDGRL